MRLHDFFRNRQGQAAAAPGAVRAERHLLAGWIDDQAFANYAKALASAVDNRPTALIGPNAYVLPVFRHLQAGWV